MANRDIVVIVVIESKIDINLNKKIKKSYKRFIQKKLYSFVYYTYSAVVEILSKTLAILTDLLL